MEETFTLIGRYQYTSEALIYKSKLESEGIEVFVRDSHTIDSNPLYSNAVGGVKLFVLSQDAEKANEVLSQVSEYSLDEKNQLIKCPNCGAEQVIMETSIDGIKSFIRVVVIGAFAQFFSKYKYKCQSCKSEFS